MAACMWTIVDDFALYRETEAEIYSLHFYKHGDTWRVEALTTCHVEHLGSCHASYKTCLLKSQDQTRPPRSTSRRGERLNAGGLGQKARLTTLSSRIAVGDSGPDRGPREGRSGLQTTVQYLQ